MNKYFTKLSKMEYVNYAFNTIYRQWFIPSDYIPTQPTTFRIKSFGERSCSVGYSGTPGVKSDNVRTYSPVAVRVKPVNVKPVNGKPVNGNPSSVYQEPRTRVKPVVASLNDSGVLPSTNVWHMYNPVHCLRVFCVYRESLRSVEEHFRNRRHEDLCRGNYDQSIEYDDRIRKNRIHAYICALYNYAHICDYNRFYVEYNSDTYPAVREETLLELNIDLDLICNTILIALAVRTPGIVRLVEEEDNNWIPVSVEQLLNSDADENEVVTILLHNSKIEDKYAEIPTPVLISAITIEDIEYRVYIPQSTQT